MRIESKTGAGAVVEPRDDVRSAFRDGPDLGGEANVSQLAGQQRRRFGFPPWRILGVDRHKPLEQTNDAADIWPHHCTFPRADTS